MALSDAYASTFTAALQVSRESTRQVSNRVTREPGEGISGRGDSVVITSLTDVTVGPYDDQGTGFDSLVERLDATPQTLLIDQANGFAFIVTAMDEFFSSPGIRAEATRKAAYNLDKALDTYLIGRLVAGATGTQVRGGTTPTTLATAAAAYNEAVEMAEVLDNADVPEIDRTLLIPNWVRSLMRKDDRFIGYGTMANDERLRNGTVGEAAGFLVVASTRSPASAVTDADGVMIGWHASALVVSEALRNLRSNPSLKYSGDQVDGIHVFGAKTTFPDHRVISHVAKA